MDLNQLNQIENSDTPQPVLTDNKLNQTILPKVTTFNKKTITMLGVVMGIIILLTTIALMTPSNQNLNNQDSLQLEENESKVNTRLPEQIMKIPKSYLGQDFSSKQEGLPSIFSNPPVIPKTEYTSQSGFDDMISDEEREIRTARKSSIRFMSSNSNLKKALENPTGFVDTSLQNSIKKLNSLMPNSEEKENFYQTNSTSSFYTKEKGLKSSLSQFEIKAGSVIPVTLITGVNSDLPGYIIAQVRTNMYDTVSGQFLLLPQGTRVIGVYDSKISYAQSRLMVSWTRLILPNGLSLALEGMAGIDPAGYAGFKDKVNNHWGKIIGGALVTSMLGAGSEMIKNYEDETDYSSVAASGAAESLAQAGSKIFEKNLNIEPTIEIRPGLKFNIFVDRDLILENYKE